MQNISVKNGQTATDVAIQHAGSAEAVWPFCIENNLQITERLINGQLLKKPEVANRFVCQHFVTEKVAPSSIAEPLPAGIGYWIIGYDFKIS